MADAFDTLGLDPTLDLELSVLEQRYRDLQRQLHPDKFVQASASEKRASLARAVDVNEAYRALKDELKRAEILYVRYGGKASERDQAPADPELLMEVMELRESLAEAKANKDLDAAQALAKDVSAKQASEKHVLQSAFVALAQGKQNELSRAGQALSRLRYYRRFQDEVALIEEEALG